MYKLCKEDRLRREELRGKYAEGPRWYGVMTHWGQENRLKAVIESSFGNLYSTEVLLPDLKEPCKSSKRTAPQRLFSGYLFLHCQMHDELYMQVSSYPQVVQILGSGYRIPAVIETTEINHLKSLLAFQPRPQMVARSKPGDLVEVVDGLLKGLVGRVIQINAAHIKIVTTFSFLGSDSGIAVSLPYSSVRSIAEHKGRNFGDRTCFAAA